MEKLEVCKKLSRLGWMSQAVIDNKVSGMEAQGYGILRDSSLHMRVQDLIMCKITWGETHHTRFWSDVYEDYARLGACIRDIA